MPFTRILVPTDFSELSRAAVARADELARSFDARLTILHVAEENVPESTSSQRSATDEDGEAAHVTRARGELETLAASLTLPAERVRCEVLTGSPVTRIITASDDHDLIVMPTHGRSGTTAFMMGSVAERVVRGSRCSTLVVKGKS